MATIYVPRQQNPWIQALQNIAISYLGGQLQAGLERTKAAQNFEAQKAVYDAMAAQGQQAGGQAPVMYDIAPGAVASRASEAMTGTGTPYAPETVSPEQMYHKLLTSGQSQIPTEADLISRGLGAKGAPKVGFENILKLAAAVNAQYEPQRKAAAEQKVRDLIPSGGDLRNDPNTLAQVGAILQANGYKPKEIFEYAFPNKSFEKLDLDDRIDAGAFDPVTGRADMTTYKKGINPTDLMKEKAATGRTAMTQRGTSQGRWITKEGKDGVLYRVNPATGEAHPVQGVTLAPDSAKAEWTLFTDAKGDQWRVDKATGKTERTGLKGAPEIDPARKEAVEIIGAISKLYPLGMDENTPPETAAAAANAMDVLTGSTSKNTDGAGFRFTDQQRQKLRDMGYDDDQIAAEEKRRTGN